MSRSRAWPEPADTLPSPPRLVAEGGGSGSRGPTPAPVFQRRTWGHRHLFRSLPSSPGGWGCIVICHCTRTVQCSACHLRASTRPDEAPHGFPRPSAGMQGSARRSHARLGRWDLWEARLAAPPSPPPGPGGRPCHPPRFLTPTSQPGALSHSPCDALTAGMPRAPSQ